MMFGMQKPMLVRSQSEQDPAHRRHAFQVKGRANDGCNPLLSIFCADVFYWQRKAHEGMDALIRTAFSLRKAGAEDLMPLYQQVECSFERLQVERTLETQ